MHSPAIWLSNHLYSNFKIWLYCLNKLFKISVLKIVINERRSQTSITHGANFIVFLNWSRLSRRECFRITLNFIIKRKWWVLYLLLSLCMQFLAERRVAKTRNYDWFWNFQNTHHFAIDAPLSILCINVFRILNRKDFRISRAQAQRWERSPPGPGFDSQTWRHMWVKFVASSRPCSEGFSPGLAPRVSSALHKPTF